MARSNRFARSVAWAALFTGTLATSAALAVVTFDGTLDFTATGEWNNSKASAMQTNYTGFGDQKTTPGGAPGSELDELFVTLDANFLYVGVTGNLEQNGNTQIILLDVRPGGQNILKTEIAPVTTELPCAANGPPGAVQGLGQALTTDVGTGETLRDAASTGTTLDSGFAPDYAIHVDTRNGTLFVSQYNLGDPTTPIGTWNDPGTPAGGLGDCSEVPQEALPYHATRVYRGYAPINTGTGTLSGGTNPNSSKYAYNNTGRDGVTGPSIDPPPAAGSGLPGDPRTQTKGLDAKISLKDLGFTTPISGAQTFGVMVLLASESGYVSNQTLPGIGAGASTADLGYRPDFTAVAGNQYASVTKTPATVTMTTDGQNIPTKYGLANVVASQNTVTSFGNRDCMMVQDGSELDELYARTDGTYLYVGVSGNLKGDGNAIVLLMDTDTTPGVGQNILKTEIAPRPEDLPCASNGPPSAVQGLGQALMTDTNGATVRDPASIATQLDYGFEPDHAIALDTAGGNVHVTQYDLFATAQGTWNDPGTPAGGLGDCTESPQEALEYYATRTYRGSAGLNAGSGVLTGGVNPNNSEFAFNNTGLNGVTYLDVNYPGSAAPGDPQTQTTGLEAKIALADLGVTATGAVNMQIQVLLIGPNGYISNQSLPPMGYGTLAQDLGYRGDIANYIPGSQFTPVTLTVEPSVPVTIDGTNIVSEFGQSAWIASQDSVTSFGDTLLVENPNCDSQQQNGSEIDQIFVRDGASPDGCAPSLQIGITGNLETNGNKLVLWFDTKTGGEGSTVVLGAHSGTGISGLAGNKLPLDADYAIVMNAWGGTVYVDLIDIQANASVYMGNDPANTGDGVLEGGAVSTDWRVALNNTNSLGVQGPPPSGPAGSLDPQTGNAASATTGFEMNIPLSAIGSPVDGRTVKVFATVAGGGGYLSNQLLPALASGGAGNWGNAPQDLVAGGYNALPLTLGAVCNAIRFDADGDGDVDMNDFGAFQVCYSGGSGDNTCNPLYPATVTVGAGTYPCACFDAGGNSKNGAINDEDYGAFQLCGGTDGRPGANTPPLCSGQ